MGRSVSHLTDLHRHGFLVLAMLAGPLGGAVLHGASHLGQLEVPRLVFDGATLVNAFLLAPVLEELVFRAGIQSMLEGTALGRLSVPGGVSLDNVLTSVLFSAAHLMVGPPWLAASIFFPSIVLGRLKQLYPSLLPVILVHAWYNVCYFATDGTRLSLL
jgi:membrane protease YdiL (CAAX protease family)